MLNLYSFVIRVYLQGVSKVLSYKTIDYYANNTEYNPMHYLPI